MNPGRIFIQIMIAVASSSQFRLRLKDNICLAQLSWIPPKIFHAEHSSGRGTQDDLGKAILREFGRFVLL